MRRKRPTGEYAELPGLREHLRQRFARDAASDPRAFLGCTGDDDEQPSAHTVASQSQSSPVVQAARRRLELLDSGETIVIPRWMVGGNSFREAAAIPWIADRSVSHIAVDRHDRIMPVQTEPVAYAAVTEVPPPGGQPFADTGAEPVGEDLDTSADVQ